MTDIHDHRPDSVLMEYENHADTANTIRPYLPDDVTRCRGELNATTGKRVCPRRKACKRFMAAPTDRITPEIDYLCTPGIDMCIPIESPTARAIRETEDALRAELEIEP